MFLVLIALGWMYVVVMMALAEATSPVGSVLGAVVTFFLYGVGPVALVLYILGTPMRRRIRREREAMTENGDGAGLQVSESSSEASSEPSSDPPDAGREPAADAVAPVRKKL